MGQTIKLNQKANVKQKTAADILPSNGLPVIAEYTADSVIGQTLIPASGSLPFSIDTTKPQNVWVFINGQRLLPTKDFTFLNIDGSGLSSQIQLNSALGDVFPICISKLGIKPEAEFGVDTRFQELYDVGSDETQGYISEASLLTAVTGTPSTGQFRTFGIQNRASIPDLANNLKARMGIERIMTQQLSLMQTEFGPNGEQVWKPYNDDRNQIRFVGNDWTSTVSNQGVNPDSAGSSTTDFVEIVFFGTGLNVLTLLFNSSQDYRVTVDGGTESGNILGASYSSVLASRNANANQVVNLASGLSLGLHTIKLRRAVASIDMRIMGFEVLNESSNVNVRPGVAYIGNRKRTVSSESSVAYNSGFESFTQGGASTGSLGTRGARVLHYLKSDSTIGKAAYLVNGASAYLTSADHTYEDVVRGINFREFSAGRSDDFSTLSTSILSAGSSTLEDGTATLVGNHIQTLGSALDGVCCFFSGDNGFLTITFVGTGLDIKIATDSSTRSFTAIYVDGGATIGTMSKTANTQPEIRKVVSGLPYGTHTVKFENTSGTSTPVINQFIVYQPKKPALPSGAIELADYCLMANYVGSSSVSALNLSTGTLFKSSVREATYVGSGWAISQYVFGESGFQAVTSTATDYVEYTFFGTGIEFRFDSNSVGANATVSIDGSSNLSSYTTALVINPTGGSFTPATGTLVTTSTSGLPGCSLQISGLTLGKHKIRVTNNSGNGLRFNGFNVITPVHSHKRVGPAVVQNTLSVGSNAIGDTRAMIPTKNLNLQKVVAQAYGVTSGPSISTLSTPLAQLDMVTTVKSPGAWYDIQTEYQGLGASATTMYAMIFVNGVQYGGNRATTCTAAAYGFVANHSPVYLPPGDHTIMAFWQSDNATLTAIGINRHLTVMEQ